MKVKDHWQFLDHEYEEVFQNKKLKPSLFSHEAHIRLAFIHISKYGEKQAVKNLCFQIKSYAESLGAHDKFNKTVTVASVKIMWYFMCQSEATSFKTLVLEFPFLISDFRSLLQKHYSYNVFADKAAKKEFVEPDLLPFDGVY